jgi:putative Mg2+ transporter-C (MgtC) family protein
LQLIGALEGKSKWKRYPLLYEVRGVNATLMFKAILKVMDQEGYRMNVIERDSLPDLERVTFVVTANRQKHTDLLTAMRASPDTDNVIAFPDTEQG